MGFVVVALFLLTFYRVLGVIAVGALLVYAIYFFALIKLIPITLTLPGIAGLILTIGVAADANIVIFERVKEEMRAGRSVPAGIAAGYKQGPVGDHRRERRDASWSRSSSSCWPRRGSRASPSRSASARSSRCSPRCCARRRSSARCGALADPRRTRPRSAPASGERRSRFDFMGASKWFFSMSGVILLIGALAIGGKGLNFGIDFESGTRITAALDQADQRGRRARRAGRQGFGDAKIQTLNGPRRSASNGFQISTEEAGPASVAEVQTDAAAEVRRPTSSNYDSRSGPTFGQTVANERDHRDHRVADR